MNVVQYMLITNYSVSLVITYTAKGDLFDKAHKRGSHNKPLLQHRPQKLGGCRFGLLFWTKHFAFCV